MGRDDQKDKIGPEQKGLAAAAGLVLDQARRILSLGPIIERVVVPAVA